MSDFVNTFILAHRRFDANGKMDRATHVVPRITCADGFNVSIQASSTHYCQPREDRGPWYLVELGFPTAEDHALAEYAEEPDSPLQTVYGYVPVHVVNDLIERHGGVDDATQALLAKATGAA